MKSKKRKVIAIILIIVAIIAIAGFSIRNSYAENTGGTPRNRADEATLVRMTATTTKLKSSANEIDTNGLRTEIEGHVGTNVVTVEDKSSEIILVTFLKTGNQYEVNKISGLGGGYNPEEVPVTPGEPESTYVSIGDIYDSAGTNPDGLHIGDFVNYDAGTWTQTEIDAIQTGKIGSLVTANGSTSLPNTAFQFGGFTAGSSRNGNATPYNTTYNYVQEKISEDETTALTGWRVFDIEGDKVTLISAGNPEDYYHYYSTAGDGYRSEYVLTGNVNSGWNTTEAENYQKRDWSNYVNTVQKGESATVLTKSKLDSWYTKYTNTSNADTWIDATFQKIYTDSEYQKYQNMIENYSYYWLSAAHNSYSVYNVYPYYRNVNNYHTYAFGVRVLVSLSSDVQFTATKTGTKTVTGGHTTAYGGDQTYNCWGIR